MKHIVVVLLTIFLIGVGPVAASPLVAPSNVRLDGLVGQSVVEKTSNTVSEPGWQQADYNSDMTRQMDSRALSEVGHEQLIEGDAHTGVAYPVTRSISVGLAYNLEEMEDLSKGHVQLGTVSVDYQNHSLLVRARWSFN